MTAPALWTTERIPATNRDGLPDKYQEFGILLDGKQVGTLKWASRSKNAGGPAWRGLLRGVGPCGMDVTFWSWNKQTVLDWARSEYPMRLRQQAAHATMDETTTKA